MSSDTSSTTLASVTTDGLGEASGDASGDASLAGSIVSPGDVASRPPCEPDVLSGVDGLTT
jgi:hypothetical protein